jgi:CHAT domain-containing protein
VYAVREKEKWEGGSRDLYRLLIEPALPHIHGKDFLIIPHDVLHYLPHQALLSPQGKYLIQDYTIEYLSARA